MTPQEARDLAASWAGRGIPAFPIGLKWNAKDEKVEKRPLTKNGHLDATTDSEQLAALFAISSLKAGERWGVGLFWGPPGYLVLDVDIKGGGSGASDVAELVAEGLDTTVFTKVDSASGGWHLIGLKPIGGEVGNLHVAPGIEIRADKGWTVAPGTATPWGSWIHDPASPKLTETAVWPCWVIERGERRAREPLPDTALEGDRHATLLRIAGALRRQGADGATILAALRQYNEDHCQPPKADHLLVVMANDLEDRYQPEPDPILQVEDPDDIVVGIDELLVDSDVIPVWGEAEECLWSRGEPFMIYSRTGLGKTTLAQRLLVEVLGAGDGSLLGLPVVPIEGKALVLCWDRPRQWRRSLRRMVTPAVTERLRGRLYADPRRKLLRMLRDVGPAAFAAHWAEGGYGLVVIDSLKDVDAKLSSEEGGAFANELAQELCAVGIEVLTLHHPRKSQQGDDKDLTLDDVFGSMHITGGHGSILALQGNVGEGVLKLVHVKPPMEVVGPWSLTVDYYAGTVTRMTGLIEVLRGSPTRWWPTLSVAKAVTGKENISKAEIDKIRRQLNGLRGRGLIEARKEGSGVAETYEWRMVQPATLVVPEKGEFTEIHQSAPKNAPSASYLVNPFPSLIGRGEEEEGKNGGGNAEVEEEAAPKDAPTTSARPTRPAAGGEPVEERGVEEGWETFNLGGES